MGGLRAAFVFILLLPAVFSVSEVPPVLLPRQCFSACAYGTERITVVFMLCMASPGPSGSGDLCEELRSSLSRPGGVSGVRRRSFGAGNSAEKQPSHCPQ